MKKENYERSLWGVEQMLEDNIANFLDVNRQHIKLTFIHTDIIGENYPDEWETDDDFFAETYYLVGYKYRKDLKTFEYEDEKLLVWLHIEDGKEEIPSDVIMTVEDFEKRFEETEE